MIPGDGHPPQVSWHTCASTRRGGSVLHPTMRERREEEKEEEGEEGEEGDGEETSLLDHQASLEGLDIDRWVPDHLDT